MYIDDDPRRQHRVVNDHKWLVEKEAMVSPDPFKSPTYKKTCKKYIIFSIESKEYYFSDVPSVDNYI